LRKGPSITVIHKSNNGNLTRKDTKKWGNNSWLISIITSCQPIKGRRLQGREDTFMSDPLAIDPPQKMLT